MGGKTGPNPTDRAKRGVKRSVLTDGRGVPVAGVLDGANRNDHKLMRGTLDAIALPRPKTMPGRPQHLCLDKGYDYAEPREIAAEFGFTLHLRTRGEEAAAKRHAGAKARRWVVERMHSWLNRFRAILIRWNKKPENYLALLHFAFGVIAWRHALPGQALKQIPAALGYSDGRRNVFTADRNDNETGVAALIYDSEGHKGVRGEARIAAVRDFFSLQDTRTARRYVQEGRRGMKPPPSWLKKPS